MFQVEDIALEQITIKPDRQRQDLGDLAGLIYSIGQVGIINPVLVDESMTLVAGERRVRACQQLELATIPARIMPGLTPDDKIMIEYFENIDRKQLTWHEEIAARLQFHEYWQETQPQWGYRDTAKRLGVSLGGLSTDLELAKAIRIIPQLATENSKGRAREAYKRMQNEAQAITAMEAAPDEERAKLDEMLARHSGEASSEGGSASTEVFKSEHPEGEAFNEQAPSAEEQATPALPRCLYEVCEFQSLLSRLPDGMVGFCEIDPPYAINFDGVYAQSIDGASSEADWSVEDFHINMTYLLKHLHAKLMPSSWVLCWTGGEHEEFLQQLALDYDYIVQPPGYWFKPGGSCNTPDRVMIHNYEKYLLFRKGDARFNTNSLKAGIEFAPVPSARRYHQWQKPEELYRHFFRALARPGTLFFSPFAGSGMSMIISTFFGMVPIGCDISQKYYYQFYARLKEMSIESDLSSQDTCVVDSIIE